MVMELPSVVPVSKLARYSVVNLQGEDMGQVESFMLDLSQGRVAFVVVSFGGVLGLTDKWFALPWEILTWSLEDKRFIINMPREILEEAPGLDKNKWPDGIDLSWLRACYTHYGCAPYWDIEVTEDHIRRMAYSIWEAEGRPEGKEEEHYLRAQHILKEQQSALQPALVSVGTTTAARRVAPIVRKSASRKKD